jgi:uncharacterized protein
MPTKKRTDYLTATDFFKFLNCPHWPYYDRFATKVDQKLKRNITESEQKRMNDGIDHEQRVMEDFAKGKNLIKIEELGEPNQLFAATKKAMEEGAEYIYQGTLLDGDWYGRPDILVRQNGASGLGNWHYVPLDIKSAHKIKDVHKYQLTFYALLLERIQGLFPTKVGIINVAHETFWTDPNEWIKYFDDVFTKIEKIRKGDKPDPVYRKSCHDTSPWGEVCLKFAEKTNDIALLYNVSTPKLQALRGFGINTIDDAAEMDPSLYVEAPGLTLQGLESMKLQARSLLDNKIFIKKPVELPEAPLEIHFDIESDPPNDADYLYGFLLRKEGQEDEYIRFLAEKPEDEKKMWKEFLKWLETLPSDYVVYHYHCYEPTRLNLLEARHGGSKWLDLFRSNLYDIKTPTTKSITFPLHFYSLKKVCGLLGYEWKSDLKSGGESIDRYALWLSSGDRAILDDIILYNEGDVRATAFLKDWMEENGAEVGEVGE